MSEGNLNSDFGNDRVFITARCRFPPLGEHIVKIRGISNERGHWGKRSLVLFIEWQ